MYVLGVSLIVILALGLVSYSLNNFKKFKDDWGTIIFVVGVVGIYIYYIYMTLKFWD